MLKPWRFASLDPIMATLQDILAYYRRYWTPSLFTLVASSLFEIIDLVVPYAIGQILNVLSQHPPDPLVQSIVTPLAARVEWPQGSALTLAVLMGTVFIVTVLKAPIQPWLTHWMHWDISHRAKRDHYTEAHMKLLTLPLDYFDENNSGRIAALVARGISNHTWTFPQIVGQMIPKLVRVMAIFSMILVTEWRIGIVFLISFTMILGLSLQQLRKLSRWEKQLEDYGEETSSRTSEIITNIKTIKAFATESRELKRQQERLNREFKILNYRIHHGYVKLNVLRTTVVQGCTFLILLFALVATLRGVISLGHFVMVLTVSGMAFTEVIPIGTFAEYFARRYAAMARLDEFLKLPAGADAVSLGENAWRGAQTTVQQPTIASQLEFRWVTFGYHTNRPVLQEFNLMIKPRQTVALVGRSGSGKSTLVKLLFRYFEPQAGQILLNGQNIQTLDVAEFRQRLAIVHQDVDLFNGTILENLVYGDPAASFEQVQAACRIAQVDQFVRDLPQGYTTMVGERGIRLSGGQKQRLGIARALIKDPEILIFDEATSSLDYESERAIQQAMQGILGTRTTIIIAHRLSTIRDADLIVVLDQGRIAEMGSHTDLLQQPGLYSRLHALQESGEILV